MKRYPVDAEHFDVVVTDLKMSSLGGMEVLAVVSKKTSPDIRVIIMIFCGGLRDPFR